MELIFLVVFCVPLDWEQFGLEIKFRQKGTVGNGRDAQRKTCFIPSVKSGCNPCLFLENIEAYRLL